MHVLCLQRTFARDHHQHFWEHINLLAAVDLSGAVLVQLESFQEDAEVFVWSPGCAGHKERRAVGPILGWRDVRIRRGGRREEFGGRGDRYRCWVPRGEVSGGCYCEGRRVRGVISRQEARLGGY